MRLPERDRIDRDRRSAGGLRGVDAMIQRELDEAREGWVRRNYEDPTGSAKHPRPWHGHATSVYPRMKACNVAAAQCSAAEDEPDPSESRVRVRIDLHPVVAFADPGSLPGPVLRLEGDLGKLWTAREQAPADLVDQVLDRAAVELVERAVDEVTDLLRVDVAVEAIADRVHQVGVAPAHIQVDEQRAIGRFGQRCVCVAMELREGAAGDLDELHAVAPGRGRRDARRAALARQVDLRDRGVVARAAEQD